MSVGRSTFASALISQKRARSFRSALLRWYGENGRDLPWRRTRDPYAILVSEFMLQQTQVATVLSYYNEWLERFPDFAALARASESDVLHAWQGLGYYARAQNLHATAKLVLDRHGGRFPESIAQMRQLPGVGRYTAHAVASFAFNQSVPIVEANTARVLARLFDLRLPIDQKAGHEALWNHAATLLPKSPAHVYNSALIDLGALVCLSRPKCAICPVKKFCRARRPEILPIKKARPPVRQLTENHAFVLSKHRILLEQAERRWRGMWILPALKLDRLKQSSSHTPVYSSVFPFTQHRVALRVFRRKLRRIDLPKNGVALANKPSRHWFSIGQIDSIPIPSPHRRAIVSLLSGKRFGESRLQC